jgi:serine/threonine protein kinase
VIGLRLVRSTPPSAIAPYKVTPELGEGGMGVVYRATETKLNRDVVIKALPDSFVVAMPTRNDGM